MYQVEIPSNPDNNMDIPTNNLDVASNNCAGEQNTHRYSLMDGIPIARQKERAESLINQTSGYICLLSSACFHCFSFIFFQR